MLSDLTHIFRILGISAAGRAAILAFACLLPAAALGSSAKEDSKFKVVLDPGHGGKDFGAVDNGAREKDINLSVALKVGELCRKKLKETSVIFTRDDDRFISLQQRADIANNAKADFFVSIHTNSLDKKNRNRTNVAGASVYTQGPHKDEANMEIARRENSVIELENGFEQKYSGFDPSRDESYIIFEMAQKNNLSESARFAKDVQQNLVKVAGRKDRGVHQAGFWVLWSTSMPSILIELDFICNPESAKFLTSKDGVDKMAEAIFHTIKVYEQNFLQKRRMLSEHYEKGGKGFAGEESAIETKDPTSEPVGKVNQAKSSKKSGKRKKSKSQKKRNKGTAEEKIEALSPASEDIGDGITILSVTAAPEVKDLTHINLEATSNQKRPRYSSDGRRRRSERAKILSDERDVNVGEIQIVTDHTSPKETPVASVSDAAESPKKEIKSRQMIGVGRTVSDRHAGKRKSLKAKSEKN